MIDSVENKPSTNAALFVMFGWGYTPGKKRWLQHRWWSSGTSTAPSIVPANPITGSAASRDPHGSSHAAPATRHKNISIEEYYLLPDGICVNDDDPIPTNQSRWVDGPIREHKGGRLEALPSHFSCHDCQMYDQDGSTENPEGCRGRQC